MLQSMLRDMESRPLHYTFYVTSENYDYSHCRIDNLNDKVDLVNHYLISKLGTRGLAERVYKSRWCKPLKKGMEFVDPASDKMPEAETNPAILDQKRKQRGIENKPEAKSTPITSAAVRRLWDKGKGLFHIWNRGATPECFFSAFFVWKQNGLLRVIMDCRWTNIQVKTSEAKFSIFSFEALRQVIDNLSIHKKWYAVNFDLRHWFHQIPLPNRYKPKLGFRMMDQHEKNFFLYSRVCPLAQCCSWALILTTPNNEQHNPKEFDLPHPDILAKGDLPFPWIPLTKGGGIFLILDNMLVLTPDQLIAENWFNRIIDNCDHFHAVLKSSKNKDLPIDAPEPKVLNDKEALRAECFFEMNAGSDTHFTFAGVDWWHACHRIVLRNPGDTDDVPNVRKDRNDKNYNEETGTWTGTFREAAKISGLLQYHRRVHGIRYYEHVEESKALRALFSLGHPPDGMRWSDTTTIPADVAKGLCAAWKRRKDQEPAAARPLVTKLERSIWVVGDAATN
jgi:hypothetical protein